MKRLIPLIALLLFAEVGYAQYFSLAPAGFVAADNLEYAVVDFPDTKQDVLYKNVLRALTSMYKDPKEVLSVVEGESITVKGYEQEAILDQVKLSPIQIGKTTYKYDISYTLSIQFKDNKIRFNRPSFECRRWYEGGYKSGWATGWSYLVLVKDKNSKYAVFDKNGKVLSQEALDGLEGHFNNLTKDIIEKSKAIDNW
ncbi:DUF4468 domain-containing protein [Sphingobacterium corticibacter]|uniref:DUF4468 domain-containing protein n=1 Tax=Sphingobacterium corticibacter TaxID=2171749 RepID=A0A2T8HMW0_9SPHI|nr:DUF4468 domain-containing protein [Sphingobacterium corticibacter]PVH26781.1 hypothetical protein DC487_04040 [Sphingobacterium corticibacter]